MFQSVTMTRMIKRGINLAFKKLIITSSKFLKTYPPSKALRNRQNGLAKICSKPDNETVVGDHQCEDIQKNELLHKNVRCTNDTVSGQLEKNFCEYCNMHDSVGTNHFCFEKRKAMFKILRDKIEIDDKNSFYCKKCNMELAINTLLGHVNGCQNTIMLFDDVKSQCRICEACFDNDTEVMNHLNSITYKVMSFCTVCTIFRTSILDHSSKCGPSLLFCVNCGKNVKKDQLVQHECFHLLNENEQYENLRQFLEDSDLITLCHYCGRTLPRSVKVMHFEKFHKEELRKELDRSFSCNYCHTTFPNIREYRKHRRLSHKIFLCHLCGVQLRSSKQQGHLDSHEDIKRYKCKKCPKSFRYNSTLKKHGLVHSNIAKYKCEICSKSFKSNYNLKVHKRSHADVKPFECVICHHTYTTKQWRDNHLKTHKVTTNRPEGFESFLSQNSL